MNRIYLYEGPFERGDAGWNLVRRAAMSYGWEGNLPYDFAGSEICRTDRGKPFFVDLPVEFSLSHSGMMWMCMFSQAPCGLDLQQVETGRDITGISKRLYTIEEQHYVDLWGIEGFYEIWARKEAFGKCTGRGIFSEMPSMVDEQSELCDQVEYDGVIYGLWGVEICPDVKCAYCMADSHSEPAELRVLE